MKATQSVFILILFSITPYLAFADGGDTTYIKTFKRKYNVQFNSWLTDIDVLVNPIGKDKDFGIKLQPNVKGQAGFAFGFKHFTVALGFQLPGTESDVDKRGKSQYYDFSFGYFQRKFGGEIYYRYFQGMQRGRNDFALATIRPDIYVSNGGFNFFYAANHKKFSMRSAFSQQEQQIKSAGSFLLLTNFQFRNLLADSSIIAPIIDNEPTFSDLAGLKQMRFITFSLRPGYGYNFLSKNGRWFFSPSIFLGLGSGWYTSQSNIGFKTGLPIDAALHAKIFVGYNHPEWYISAFYAHDSNLNIFKSSFVNLDTRSVGINLGYRINSIGTKWL
jgi:hypothetical protein